MEIKICNICKGTEQIKETKSDFTEWGYIKCPQCNGTGRVKTCSYSYTVPYDMDSNKIYEVDNKIWTLIRALENDKT